MTLIDVGGYRLDLERVGTGGPAVVCLSSAGGAHEPWQAFVPLVSGTTTVITYGRPALGGSDALPPALRGPSGVAWVAAQLRGLLVHADVPAPYVLVSSSMGGYIADQYAACWPVEVAGAVWIDPSPPREFPQPTRFTETIADTDDDTGLLISREKVYTEQQYRSPLNHGGRFVVLSGSVGYWERLGPRPWQAPLTPAEIDAAWVEMQAEWTARLDAAQVIADDAGHHVQIDSPDLAAAVVLEVVTAAREDRPVAFDPAALATVRGRCSRPASSGP